MLLRPWLFSRSTTGFYGGDRFDGGLYVWLTVPEDMPTGFDSPLFRHAVHETGVMYVPGELFYAGPEEQRPTNQMRLSYGVETAESIREGIARLARSIREVQS